MSSIRALAEVAPDQQTRVILVLIDKEFDRFDRLLEQLRLDVASLAEGGRAARRVYDNHELDAWRRVCHQHARDPKFEAQLEAHLGSTR